MKLISFVFPCYNESGNIDKLYEELTNRVNLIKEFNFEFVFSNDGSTDDTLDLLYALEEKDSRVVIVNLSKNFGHQNALSAGLKQAKGDAIIMMDADLQDPISVSIEMIEKWKEGFDVVSGRSRKAAGGKFKKVTRTIFYSTLSSLTEIDIPADVADFRLVDRQVLDVVNNLNEHERFLRGLFAFVGFKQTIIDYAKDSRYAGETKYSLKKMIQLAKNGIFGFSSLPLRLITHVGIFMFLAFLALGIYVLAGLLLGQTVAGWASLMLVMLFIASVQMLFLGIIGEYVGRIHLETQNRPIFIIDKKRNLNGISKPVEKDLLDG